MSKRPFPRILDHPAIGDPSPALLDETGQLARADLCGALQLLQARYGYLPSDVLVELSRRSGISLARIYGVATFYEQFSLVPRGETIIRVCHGTACHVVGAPAITDALCEALDVAPGGTTADGRYTVESVACVGCCSLAPVLVVGAETHGRITPAVAVARVQNGGDVE